MREKANGRRAGQKAEEADGRDKGDADLGRDGPGAAGQAVAQGHNGGHAEAHQGQAHGGRHKLARGQGQGEACGNAQAAGLQDRGHAVAVHKAVCQQASHDHEGHAGKIAQTDKVFLRLNDLGKEDRTPVVHGAFGGHAAKGNEAKDYQEGTGPDAGFLLWLAL